MNRPQPTPTPDPQLEAVAEAELKRLPLVPAPPAMAAGVMARLRAREQRPWWQGVWWEWPWQARVASVLLALVLAGAFGGGNVLFEDRVTTYSDEVTARFGFAGSIWTMLESLGSAVVLVWSVLGQPWLLVLGGIVAALSLAGVCFGLRLALVRVTGQET
jgi:hypothetical protein